ncbi:F-box protein PP2-A13-like, partial [Olea europaea var. sylvestris]|uniref:F-box protein PP2-A13-like n=1 Tax=Olea europaea var. sylvestris TaxID=158386 RepID=UPI000C1D64A0
TPHRNSLANHVTLLPPFFVLSYLDQSEITKLAWINQAFRVVVSADFIWVPNFPPTTPFILSKLFDQSLITISKKDLYVRLSKPNPYDGGTKVCLWIDKRIGGTCLSISSKMMVIMGIDNRRYWNHIQTSIC